MKNLIPFLVLLLCMPSYSQFQVAEIFSDNMVLQAATPINIWGKAAPGSVVRVEFAGETYSSTVEKDASWSIVMRPLKASDTPRDLRISHGETKLLFQNILIGDVWLLLGQSNMEWPMQSEAHYQEEIPEADNNLLRFYNPNYIGKNIYSQAYTQEQNERLKKEEMFTGTWEESNPETFKRMSAIGYYFGKRISEKQQIPIGLINLSIGGAPIETFIDSLALSKSAFAGKLKGNWLENENLPVWIRERGGENVGFENLNHAYRPGYVYKTGIAPIIQFPIRGILWYQGESNAQEAERVMEYDDLQNLMVTDLREKWESPELPFYFVQLSSIDTLNYKSHLWPEFRNEQLKSLESLDHMGMAVSLDKGAKNDVHPRNKKIIGERLSRWALKGVYGEEIEVSGPLPKEVVFSNGQLVLSFTHTLGQLKTEDGGEVKGFSINGQQVPATIVKDKILIRTDQKPEFIHYAWEPFSSANLQNADGLPAPTFEFKVNN